MPVASEFLEFRFSFSDWKIFRLDPPPAGAKGRLQRVRERGTKSGSLIPNFRAVSSCANGENVVFNFPFPPS
jgi:hypothetical protein